jgi:PIN domain nuclease of toxin-antitoxin system
MSAVLLDTCAIIWLMNRDPALRTDARELIDDAGASDGVFVSPVSAWEIGLLSVRRTGAQFRPDAKAWFAKLMTGPGVKLAALTPEMAIEASALPGNFHSDPADRMLIATARALAVPLVTRDAKILAYAAAGHVDVVAC